MSKKDDRFRQYENLMKKSRKDAEEKPTSCKQCLYHRPEFRFRSCLHTRCPYKKDEEIFRKHPLEMDFFDADKGGE